MDLLEFARSLPTDFTEAEFIDELRKVVDLDQIRHLSDAECQNMYDAVAYLADYLLLLREFRQKAETSDGHPVIEYRAPVIWNQLTRDRGEKPDFTQLTTFGIEQGRD
ncbi:MAG: hypothetical protein ACK5LJ_04905 [Paracoccus sp. (in: a-proteobacteria)]